MWWPVKCILFLFRFLRDIHLLRPSVLSTIQLLQMFLLLLKHLRHVVDIEGVTNVQWSSMYHGPASSAGKNTFRGTPSAEFYKSG